MPGYDDAMQILNSGPPSSVDDSAPAHISDFDTKMSMMQLASQGNLPPPPSQNIPKNEDQNIFSRIGQDMGNRAEQISNDYDAYQSANTGLDRTAFRIAGNGISGGIKDIANEGLKSIGQTAEPYLASMVTPEGKAAFTKASDYISNSPPVIAAKEGIAQIGDEYKDLSQYNQDLSPDLNAEGNIAVAVPSAQAITAPIQAVASMGEKGALTKLLKSSSSDPNYVSPAPIPPVKPQIAKLVKDASDIGINIPPQVFNPGPVSSGLDKIGMMKTSDMKSQVTTALSKIMGHEGTPNLDTGTMGGIYKQITGKMNDFALKADDAGGIPIANSDLQEIVANSNAAKSKVKGLVAKIQNLAPDGNLSGKDYQLLTKRDGVLDRAMRSSDSDFADSARDFREHLDNQLEKTVAPDDLVAFKEARKQYRTMKIVQPLVESGGVTGQADSASKLYNAVNKNYGSIENALQYNPQLGKIAQIVNEFPQSMADVKHVGRLAKISGTIGSNALAAGAATYLGGPTAGVTAAALSPFAIGAGKYLSSDMYKNALLRKSLNELPSGFGAMAKDAVP